MIDEGYTKYQVDWQRGDASSLNQVNELILWRKALYDKGLIGEYKDLGIGFGNLSARTSPDGQFVISGTQTGHLANTGPEHYALVTNVDIDANTVRCVGPIQASSEAMTHAAIYALDSSIHAVVHVHSRNLWLTWLGKIATTRSDIAYGTPDMAREFRRLYESSEFSETGIAVMAGHEEGLISIGRTVALAAERILALETG